MIQKQKIYQVTMNYGSYQVAESNINCDTKGQTRLVVKKIQKY